MHALSDGDRDVREAALAGVLRTGSQSAEVPVIGMLCDKDPGIRIGALCVLSRIGTELSVGPVTKLFDDPFFDVRDQAARTAGEIRKRNRL